jgi:hypothetical protein
MPQINSHQMKKHKFNIFPEANQEDFDRLVDSIRINGFDKTLPVIVYNGEVIDGWNRVKACEQLGIEPRIEHFQGTDQDAMQFIIRSNTRRNLNKGQWATIAVEASAMMEELKAEAEKRMLAGKLHPVQKVAQGGECAHKSREVLAKAHNTNHQYVAQARALKAEAPDVFERVKAGKLTIQDGRREASKRPTTEEWLPDELLRKAEVEAGLSVVANFKRDKHLIAWAEREGKAVTIDRTSEWGNPFVLGKDGSRDEVCDFFVIHFMQVAGRFDTAKEKLSGKVLCCHCYPERCHGSEIISWMR